MMKTLLLLISTLFMLAPSVPAELLVNLSPSQIGGKQWRVLTLRGMLTNAGSERIYLNGMNLGDMEPGHVLDTTIFFEKGPVFLESGESWTGDLLDVYVNVVGSIGSHIVALTFVGGGDEQATDNLAAQYFQVTYEPIFDYNNTGIVDLSDLAFFAESWLGPECNEENGWCDDRDINHLGSVDLEDFVILSRQWLRTE